jgi:hypothetical protein
MCSMIICSAHRRAWCMVAHILNAQHERPHSLGGERDHAVVFVRCECSSRWPFPSVGDVACESV